MTEKVDHLVRIRGPELRHLFSEGRRRGKQPSDAQQTTVGLEVGLVGTRRRRLLLDSWLCHWIGRIRKLSSSIFARRSWSGGRGDSVVKQGPQPDVRVVGPGGVTRLVSKTAKIPRTGSIQRDVPVKPVWPKLARKDCPRMTGLKPFDDPAEPPAFAQVARVIPGRLAEGRGAQDAAFSQPAFSQQHEGKAGEVLRGRQTARRCR